MRFVYVVGATLAVGALLAAPASAASASRTAKSLVIKQSDAGGGYTAVPGSPPTNTIFPKLADCVGKPVPTRKAVIDVAGTALINRANGSAISSTVTILETRAMVKADKLVVADANFPGCIENQSRSASGLGVTTTTVRRADIKRYGEFAVALDETLAGVIRGVPYTTTITDVRIMKGRIELNALFVAISPEPFDRAAVEAILDRVDKRLERAKVSK